MRTRSAYTRARGKVGGIIHPYTGIRLTPLLVLIVVVVLALARTALAASPPTLATGHLAQIGDGDWIFRVVDLTLDPNAPVVTHKHGAGMTYAISGPHVLTREGKTTTLNPGQALWVSDQITHTHATGGITPTHFLFMYLWPASKKGAPLAPGFSAARVAYESDVLTFPNRQAQDAVLADNAFASGQESGMQSYGGPTLINIQSGSFTLKMGDNSRSMQPGDYTIVQAGTPVQFKAEAAGHMLALSIVPAGQPALLPQTGGMIETAKQYTGLALIGLVLVISGLVIQRRRFRAG
jgi:quercetin dioxygenase-like cupin family protein